MLEHSSASATPEPVIHKFGKIENILTDCGCRYSLSLPKTKYIVSNLWEILITSKTRILSFDVFDTFLLRNNKPEAQRYWEISDEISKALKMPGLTAEDLYLARCLGMEIAYRTRPAVAGCREGRIEDVIRIAARQLGLPPRRRRVFFEIEKNYEKKNLHKNLVLINLAKKFKKSGGKIILISDMYLGAEVIQEICGSVAGNCNFDAVFSSADEVVSKRSGKLFRRIEAALDAEPTSFFHIGDSWIGDVQKARLAGWGAFYFPISNKELAARDAGLKGFLERMDSKGLDVRRWAKI